VEEIFSERDKTLKVAKIYDLVFAGRIFFVVVRIQQKLIYECNLWSSLPLNCSIRKEFLVQFL
jgi:hypothetical protein